eukprot:gb/GEZN01013403.1/.p1 GENE.gb/GEZN01013403.1/~~gb/GEZN01013403.1/.p1  ORF type:complete len:157 (-),score=5.30 gb/GEZN01013403.1/:95-565(-)
MRYARPRVEPSVRLPSSAPPPRFDQSPPSYAPSVRPVVPRSSPFQGYSGAEFHSSPTPPPSVPRPPAPALPALSEGRAKQMEQYGAEILMGLAKGQHVDPAIAPLYVAYCATYMRMGANMPWAPPPPPPSRFCTHYESYGCSYVIHGSPLYIPLSY